LLVPFSIDYTPFLAILKEPEFLYRNFLHFWNFRGKISMWNLLKFWKFLNRPSGFMKEVIGMTWEAVVLTLGSLLIGALVMWFQNRSK